MKRCTKIVIGVVFLTWLLTLGFFHERSVSCSFAVGGVDPWQRFEGGALRVYPNTLVNAVHYKSRGIPFLVYSTVDRAPYPLEFCFTTVERDTSEALILEDVEITYTDGYTEHINLPKRGAREIFTLDERGKERGETVYRRVNFSFPDALKKRQNCKIRLRGHFESPQGIDQYSEEIDITLKDETHFYIGWIALALRQI